jgi:hypothetical protein
MKNLTLADVLIFSFGVKFADSSSGKDKRGLLAALQVSSAAGLLLTRLKSYKVRWLHKFIFWHLLHLLFSF